MDLKLKEFRNYYQLSQTQIAESIGIDQRQYSRYETETNELPIRYLKALCKEWNISADYILGLTDNILPLCATCHNQTKITDKGV